MSPDAGTSRSFDERRRNQVSWWVEWTSFMPLYEYECEACRHRFEQIQSFSDPPIEKCPVCGAPVRKLMSMPAIQFKGSGWYITDYARKGQNADKGPDKGSGSSTESGAKSESSTPRDKSSPASDSPSSSSPTTPSTGSSSSDS